MCASHEEAEKELSELSEVVRSLALRVRVGVAIAVAS